MNISEAPKGVLRPSIIAKGVPFGNSQTDKAPRTGNKLQNGNKDNHNTDYTIVNVSRNCLTGKIAAIRQLVATVQNVEYISASDLIDGKYLPAPLLQKLMVKHQKKAVLLRGGLGIGKSTALAALMAEFFNGKGVAICHRIGLTRQLCKTFDADYYQNMKREGGVLSDRIGTTIHSLPDMLRIERASSAFTQGLIVIDESNSVAAEIITDVVKNEALTIQSIGKAVKQSGAVVCADAHLDLSTVKLLQAAGIQLEDMLLIVVDKPELEGYTVKIWEDEKNQKGKSLTKPAFINQILADLLKGLKVIVTSLSATFLEELDREAHKKGIHKRVLITSKSTATVKEQMTAESYQDYDLVMLSPAMSTGISFDRTITLESGKVIPCPEYRHADRCYVILSNAQDTGTHQDGLQAMLRERAVKDKTIRCFYQESPSPLPKASQIARGFENQIKALHETILELGGEAMLAQVMTKTRPNQNKAESFLMAQAVKVASDKQNFLELFTEECTAKGAIVKHCKAKELAAGDVTYESLLEERQKIRAEWVDARVTAIKLNEEEAVDPNDELLKPSLDRKYIEQKACIDFEQLEPLERAEWVDLILPDQGKKSLLTTVREWERAFADKSLLVEVVKAALVGVSAGDDDRVSFLEKTTTSKAHWLNLSKYTRLALQAAGVFEVNGELIAGDAGKLEKAAIRNQKHSAYALWTNLVQNPEPAITCGLLGVDTDIQKVKANPLPYMVDILASIGVKLRKGRGKEEYTVCTESLETALAMMNRRKSAGINELKERIDQFSEYLAKYQARKHAESSRDLANRRTVPDDVIEALTVALNDLGHPEKLEAATDYLEPFHSRITSGKLSYTAIALMLQRWIEDGQN
jgi:hypothetical protein